uniref:CTD9 n=1 Tax=Heliconius melpomene TaxID=34740 RepID=A0A2H4RMQ2_HELME|nr:CTD9 [Heliconius melpomene]
MIRPLPPALQEIAEKELNEKPDRIEADILALRGWLAKQPHLQAVKPSDQLLIAFLRGNKHSLERSKEKLDMFYTLRSVVPEIYNHRNPFDPALQEFLKLGILLPIRREGFGTIVLTRFALFDPSQHKLVDFIKLVFMTMEILMLEDDSYLICGEHALTDMDGVGIGIFLQWTPALAKKTVLSVEKSLPLRLKDNYILVPQASSAFEAAFNLVKTLLSEKLKKRIHIITKKEVVCDVLAKKNVTSRLRWPSLKEISASWKDKVESYKDWFLQQAEERSDESRRPGVPKTSSTLFGVEGSFRKLQVD